MKCYYDLRSYGVEMVERLVRHNDEQAVVLPRNMLDALGLGDGSSVEVELADGRISIRPSNGNGTPLPDDEKFVKQVFDEDEPVFRALAK